MKKLIAFIMNINLNPKLIVTALLKGLSNFDFLAKIKAIGAAALAHTADYPSLDPDPLSLQCFKYKRIKTHRISPGEEPERMLATW